MRLRGGQHWPGPGRSGWPLLTLLHGVPHTALELLKEEDLIEEDDIPVRSFFLRTGFGKWKKWTYFSQWREGAGPGLVSGLCLGPAQCVTQLLTFPTADYNCCSRTPLTT